MYTLYSEIIKEQTIYNQHNTFEKSDLATNLWPVNNNLQVFMEL